MTSELVRFMLASDLTKVGKGGGTPSENIRVHEVALGEARAWLTERERKAPCWPRRFFAGAVLRPRSLGEFRTEPSQLFRKS
jgi:hypothetical protein